MMNVQLHIIAGAIVFFWCGAFTAISFLEAWLKFRAPGVTISIGLGIGRLVFAALNKLEWVLAIGAAVCLVAETGPLHNGAAWLLPALVVLTLETVWLLPLLDRRAHAWQTGKPPATASTHLLFVAAETIKLICLLVAGAQLLNNNLI